VIYTSSGSIPSANLNLPNLFPEFWATVCMYLWLIIVLISSSYTISLKNLCRAKEENSRRDGYKMMFALNDMSKGVGICEYEV
jgi:uncharacterized membrane protein